LPRFILSQYGTAVAFLSNLTASAWSERSGRFPSEFDPILDDLRRFTSLLGRWRENGDCSRYWANCCCNPDWEIRLGVSVEPPKRLMDECHPVPVPFGTRSFPVTTRHLRAGLLLVPSLWDSLRCFDRACPALGRPSFVRSWAAPRLFNLNGQIELSKKLIWTRSNMNRDEKVYAAELRIRSSQISQ